MADLKARAPDLVLVGAAPRGQHFVYVSDHPMDDMLRDGYFLPLISFFWPADTIRVVQTDGRDRSSRVIETTDIEVVAVDRERFQWIELDQRDRRKPGKRRPGRPPGSAAKSQSEAA